MAGFKTVKRDGIELTGALEETLTVSAQSPTVDVQSVLVQQTLSSDVISAIPSSRNASGIQSLIPGLNVSQAGVAVSGAKSWMQGNNYTQSLKAQGLRTPSKLISLYDADAMGDGPIRPDELWFHLTYCVLHQPGRSPTLLACSLQGPCGLS